MKELMIALQAFWGSFGIPAYQEGDVPDEAVEPYITYSASLPEFMETSTHYARIWYRASGYKEIGEKADEIISRFGYGQSVMLETADGYICIRSGNPFMQRMDMDKPENKCIYINMEISNYQGVK